MVHVFCNLEEEEGDHLPMCDMTFEIAEKSYDQSTLCWNLMFVADATPFEPVGFAATIPTSGWHAQVDGEGDDAFRTYWGPVTLRSTGLNSDRLVRLLADYYGVPHPQQSAQSMLSSLFRRPTQSVPASWTFPAEIECLCVGIMSDPAKIAEEALSMKLFSTRASKTVHTQNCFSISTCRLGMLLSMKRTRTTAPSWFTGCPCLDASALTRKRTMPLRA